MQYAFAAGLIAFPAQFRTGLHPKPGLSSVDEQAAKHFYPAIVPNTELVLVPFNAIPLQLEMGEPATFRVVPDESREYSFQTFGDADTVISLFEFNGGRFDFLATDNDGGENFNAKIRMRLIKGREYRLALRLSFLSTGSQTAVMMW